MLPGFCLAALLLSTAASAQDAAAVAAADAAAEMKGPRVLSVDVDWTAVRDALAPSGSPALPDDRRGATGDALARLNSATKKIFPKIGDSPVPVLLPFDTAAFLHDEADGAAFDASKYLSGFHSSVFFAPGPAGYDAALSLQPQSAPGLDLTFARNVNVQISGSAVIYELDSPSGLEGSPVPELENQFPGIRRLVLENHLRYTFVRYGVPYFVSIICFDGPKRTRRLSCREADKVGIRFLQALTIAGGSPGAEHGMGAPQTVERPAKTSPDFTYYPSGDLIPGTGMRGQSGRADATVYSKIRFPMAQAPAYLNSQSYMNWGNCDFTGRVSLGGRGRDAAYRCRVNGIKLFRDESKNYAYPWRDNFCEHRYFAVAQCPAGLGHQGEDIRPGSCRFRNEGADRCDPYQHDVVAVRNGVALRAPGDEALYLVVNRPGEHIRFRYLHMNPQMLDAAGMVSGRELAEGEVVGAVGNYERHQGGTTYHLHFDVQVPTRQGWVFVNPYMTLVAAYERLIGGRGERVTDAMLASTVDSAEAPGANGATTGAPAATGGNAAAGAAAAEASKSASTTATAPANGHAKVSPNLRSDTSTKEARNLRKPKDERRAASAERCKTRMVKGHRRRVCSGDVAERHARGKHARGVRSVDRRVSHKGERARHHRGDVHAGHGRAKARHGRH